MIANLQRKSNFTCKSFGYSHWDSELADAAELAQGLNGLSDFECGGLSNATAIAATFV